MATEITSQPVTGCVFYVPYFYPIASVQQVNSTFTLKRAQVCSLYRMCALFHLPMQLREKLEIYLFSLVFFLIFLEKAKATFIVKQRQVHA